MTLKPNSHKTIAIAREDYDPRAARLDQAKLELHQWRTRFGHLVEFAKLTEIIEAKL